MSPLEKAEFFNQHSAPINRRDDALKDLMGNVPELQKRNAGKDVPWFKEACRSFTGYRSLEPENGASSLKGMETTLQNHQVIFAGFKGT
jgi:hypothetical protein